MQRTYPVLNRGAARLGRTEVSWWAGFEETVEVETPHTPPPVDDVTYSSSITRPACSCKILGTRLGQGCSIPVEGFPGGQAPRATEGEGPSTIALVGGAAGVGVLLALATGLI